MIKPGMVCIIKGTNWNDGKIITVLSVHKAGHDQWIKSFGDVAVVDCEIITEWVEIEEKNITDTIPTCFLQPLDNPPDNVVDETLLWLPVPQEEREYEIQHN